MGQHFLKDRNIAGKIVNSLSLVQSGNVLEIGPGKGILTQFLSELQGISLKVVELDRESVEYLKTAYHDKLDIIHDDFLKIDLKNIFKSKFSIIGNFPYNISSQIFFKILGCRDDVPEIVGMIQKEVAERIASPPGSKKYGIMSVLLQAFYNIEYLFTVDADVFEPPPKVQSGVVRLTRNNVKKLDCDEQLFIRLVKTSFNQRRKMLRNSIKTMIPVQLTDHPILTKRPEQLSVNDFVRLTLLVSENSI